MTRQECTDFLQWALPQLGLRWAGYRKVRHLVCKRVARRLRELGLAGLAEYRARVARDAAERERLRGLCRIPVSRFYRDRAVFDALRDVVLPGLARRAAGRARSRLHAVLRSLAPEVMPTPAIFVRQRGRGSARIAWRRTR